MRNWLLNKNLFYLGFLIYFQMHYIANNFQDLAGDSPSKISIS